MTVSRAAAQRINRIVVEELFASKESLSNVSCAAVAGGSPILPYPGMSIVINENRYKRYNGGRSSTQLPTTRRERETSRDTLPLQPTPGPSLSHRGKISSTSWCGWTVPLFQLGSPTSPSPEFAGRQICPLCCRCWPRNWHRSRPKILLCCLLYGLSVVYSYNMGYLEQH